MGFGCLKPVWSREMTAFRWSFWPAGRGVKFGRSKCEAVFCIIHAALQSDPVNQSIQMNERDIMSELFDHRAI